MTFLIVRPTGKAEQTAAFFQQYGLHAQSFPILDIKLATSNACSEQVNNAEPNTIIVTSTYAAQWLLDAIKKGLVMLDFTHINFVCIGQSSAEILAPIAHKSTLFVASPENSEGVLQADCLQNVSNKNVVLLKGEGGRKLIASSLLKNNAQLIEINVYKRVNNLQAIRAFTFEPSQIRCIISTSIEITKLLLATQNKHWLLSCSWIVASERIKDYACENGIQHILVSQGASKQALLACANHLVNTGVVHD
jgi:uroporphyrinogen-III synthase